MGSLHALVTIGLVLVSCLLGIGVWSLVKQLEQLSRQLNEAGEALAQLTELRNLNVPPGPPAPLANEVFGEKRWLRELRDRANYLSMLHHIKR